MLNDLAALSAMGEGICKIISSTFSSTSLVAAILHKITARLAFLFLADDSSQIYDSYVYHIRLVSVSQTRKLSWLKATIVRFFIWANVLSWIPLYTIVPTFVNTNVDPWHTNINYYWYVETTTSGLLNFYFVVEFLRAMFDNCAEFHLSDFRFALAIKSLIHFVVTIAFSSTWLFYIWGDSAYRILVIICLHVVQHEDRKVFLSYVQDCRAWGGRVDCTRPF